MAKKNTDSGSRYFGYHIYFKTIRDVKNNRVAKIKNRQIICENVKFENVILTGIFEASKGEEKVKKGKIQYSLVNSVANRTIAKVDNYYNVYSLDNRFLGTFYDSTKLVKMIIRFAIIAMLTLCIVFLMLPKTGKDVKPKELIIHQGDDEVVNDAWNIFNDIIHPGEYGEYYFKIINEDKKDRIIYLNFGDENPDNIPMRYRIKSKDKYLCGNENYWATIDNVYLEKIIISANSSETFVLEWCWLDDGRHNEEDTNAGLKESAIYTIHIQLTSELTTNDAENKSERKELYE